MDQVWFSEQVGKNAQNPLRENEEYKDDVCTLVVDTNYHFTKCKFKKLVIANIQSAQFVECSFEELETRYSGVALTRCEDVKLMKSSLGGFLVTVDSSYIRTLEITGFSDSDKFGSAYSRFDTLVLKRIKQKKEAIKFTHTIIFNALQIDHSILDDVLFDGLNLRSATLEITNSSIIKAMYYSINWPEDFSIIETVLAPENDEERKLPNRSTRRIAFDKLAISDVLKLQESYRQLKIVAINAQNKLEARKFLTNEIRMHHRQIQLERKNPTITIGKWWSLSADAAILWINKYSSDYGNSLIRPVILLFFSGMILFPFIMGSLGIEFGFKTADLSTFWKSVGYYFNFLNPIHPFILRDIYGNDVAILGVCDFMMRLLSGFFIYHIVRATRKFSFGV